MLVVDDGCLFHHILHGLRFLLEVVAFVYVLDDPFVLVFDIPYLFLQVLELHVQRFDLLNSAGVAVLSDWLGH